MGKPVQIVAVRRPRTGFLRFEIDRSLTGTGHEHYASPDEATGNRPPDVLAAALFETREVETVHIFSNIITLLLGTVHPAGSTMEHEQAGKLQHVVEQLFVHYRPGVTPTPI